MTTHTAQPTTKATHTPGPWRTDDSGAIVRLFPIGDTSGCMAIAYGVTGKHPDYMPQSEQEANARLIAAAPELLEALQRVAALGVYSKAVLSDGEYADMISQARSAIARATV